MQKQTERGGGEGSDKRAGNGDDHMASSQEVRRAARSLSPGLRSPSAPKHSSAECDSSRCTSLTPLTPSSQVSLNEPSEWDLPGEPLLVRPSPTSPVSTLGLVDCAIQGLKKHFSHSDPKLSPHVPGVCQQVYWHRAPPPPAFPAFPVWRHVCCFCVNTRARCSRVHSLQCRLVITRRRMSQL